jgi:hypothetical protein
MIQRINKKLILESIAGDDQMKHKLLLQNFLAGTDPKAAGIEQHQAAGMEAGVVDGQTKADLIKMNHRNQPIGSTYLDRDHNGIDQEDLMKQGFAAKATQLR